MSALKEAWVGDHARHGLLPKDRRGAGDEGTGSDITSVGQTDYLVAGSGDHRHL